MKKLFFSLFLIVGVTFSQVYYQPKITTDSVLIKTQFGVAVTQYAVGDIIRDSLAYPVMYPITVTPAKKAGYYVSGYVLSASLSIDTANITSGNFTVLIFSDTVCNGVNLPSLLPANNALYQSLMSMDDKYVGQISFTLSMYGTTGGGATMARSKVDNLNIPFDLGTTGYTKLWCILISDDTYTPKKGGKYVIKFRSIIY